MYGVAVQCATGIVKGRYGRVNGELFRDQTVATRGIMLVSELQGRRILHAHGPDLSSCFSLFNGFTMSCSCSSGLCNNVLFLNAPSFICASRAYEVMSHDVLQGTCTYWQ